MIVESMIETSQRQKRVNDMSLIKKLTLLATIVECEGGMILISGKGRKRKVTLKIESPMKYWCGKCKRLKKKADEI